MGGFDGATLETATYSQSRYLWTTSDDAVVGRFEPASVGRQDVASRIQVTADLVDPGDLVEVITPAGVVRDSGALLVNNGAWLVAHPGDDVAVTSARATTIDIIVNDLDDSQLNLWALDDSSSSSSTADSYSEQTITVAGEAITPFAGTKTAFTSLAAAGTVVLPSLADTVNGAVLHIVRIGGSQPTITPAAITDEINGLANVTWNQRNVGESVTYVRVSGGWQRDQGGASPETLAVSGASALTPTQDGYAAVVQNAAVSAAFTLPPADGSTGQRAGAGFVLSATDPTGTHTIVPNGADLINDQNVSKILYDRQPVLVIAQGSPEDYVMIGGYDQRAARRGHVRGQWDFRRLLRYPSFVASVGAIVVDLPVWANCGSDSRIYFRDGSGAGFSIDVQGADTINGVAGAIAVGAGAQGVIFRDLFTGNWHVVLSA
ncbi:MAG: hypothetical protein R2847_13120 [Bacteroidia bacterium]